MLTDAEFAEIESRMFDAAQAADEGNELVDNLLILLAADVPPLLAEVRRLREKTMIAEARYSAVVDEGGQAS